MPLNNIFFSLFLCDLSRWHHPASGSLRWLLSFSLSIMPLRCTHASAYRRGMADFTALQESTVGPSQVYYSADFFPSDIKLYYKATVRQHNSYTGVTKWSAELHRELNKRTTPEGSLMSNKIKPQMHGGRLNSSVHRDELLGPPYRDLYLTLHTTNPSCIEHWKANL